MQTNENDKYREKLQNAQSWAIYGSGVVAQNTYLLLSAYMNTKFNGFIVSNYDPTDKKTDMTARMYGQSICGASGFVWEAGSLIVVATSPKYWDAIEHTLKNYGCKTYLFLTSDMRHYLFINYYQIFFREKHVDIKDNWVLLGESSDTQVYIKNPFKEKMRSQNSCFSELGTIILPACYDEFKMCSETPYELEKVNLKAFVNGVVFDLGANQGYFTALAASKGHEVYSFEPSATLIDNLKDYAEKYVGRVHVVDAAIADYNGDGELNIDEISDDANSLVLTTNADHTERVRILTLDSFVRDHHIARVDFIKADIEGAERQMLAGAAWVLQTYEPMLSLCTYHLPDDPEVMEELILKANPRYKIIQREKKLYAYVEDKIYDESGVCK